MELPVNNRPMDEDSITASLNLECPMCCSKTFGSRQELALHLSQFVMQITCPICKQNYQSLHDLVEHLSTEDCNSPGIVSQLIFENEDSRSSIGTHCSQDIEIQKQVHDTAEGVENETKSFDNFHDDEETSKVHEGLDLLGKQVSKSEWQELRLVEENGESRYILLTEEGLGLNADTVVTKNNDGTISLTTLADMKVEADPIGKDHHSQTDLNEESKEVYSCNTCGISFTSVMEHIQNYHTDQEVVVEEPMDDLKYELPADNQVTPRRVITETGDIIEAIQQDEAPPPSKPKEEVNEPKEKSAVSKRNNSKRYIKVDKLCDSVIKNIKEGDGKNDVLCHKVVMQPIKGSASKVFNCVNCNLYVTKLNEFKSHPCKKSKYNCPHCSVTYDNSKSLCAHMKVHKVLRNELENIKFECEVCKTTFQSNKSLKLHRRMHDTLKNQQQIEAPVSNDSPFKLDLFLCAICDKLIPVDYRAIHQNSHQKDNDKLNCDVCNKKFTTPEFLEMHMSVHNMERVKYNNPAKVLPYSCLYCHRKFSRPHEKVKHERIHTGEKPHSCDICGKSFRVSYCLTLHMRTHTGARPYACPHCPKRFKAHSVYNHHILTHSEVRAYKCPFCPKAFKTSVQLAGHKNSHTKPFACQQCNRPFASLYAVRVHTETHKHNNLKFSCQECGASYARASALKDHTKAAHAIELEGDLVPNIVSNPVKKFKEDWMIELDQQAEAAVQSEESAKESAGFEAGIPWIP